jgi:hypothetical protein
MSEEDAYADQAKKLVDDVIESAIQRLETGMALTFKIQINRTTMNTKIKRNIMGSRFKT